jgi:hypothetical protein
VEAETAQYKTRVGPVSVSRGLFRRDGARNAKTVNTVTLRSGAVEDEWLPGTAAAMANRLARGPSREAERASASEGTLPYSHASFERIGHAVGWKRSPGSAAKRSRVARSREDGDERARRRVSEGGRVVSVGWERATRSLDRCASTCR